MHATTFPEKPSFELFLEYLKAVDVEFPYHVNGYMNFSSFDSSTYAKIATDIYKNHLKYPQVVNFTRYHVYKKGMVIASNITSEDKKQYSSTEYLIEKDEDMIAFKAEVAKYHEKSNLLNRWFVHAIKATNGVINHPKADKAYSMAYEYGHSSGYSEIASYFDEFVELIKP